MKTPLTKERLRQHLTYAWWKYLAGVAIAVLLCNLFFSLTSTRAAEDEKVELFVYGVIDDSGANTLLELMRQRDFPDQAQFSCTALLPDTVAGPQAYSVRVIVGGEGDLLVIPRDVYENTAHLGALEDLDALPGVREAMDAHGVTVEPERHYWRGSDDQRRCYGIPVSQIPVLNSLMPDGGDSYLCVRISNGNPDTVRRVLINMLENWTAGGEAYGYWQLHGS